MITFKNGPLQGHKLSLKRSPIFLRAVTGGSEPFDALDQLNDNPQPGEKLFAYVLAAPPSRGFVDGTWYSGPVIWAEYEMIEPQPMEQDMRDTDRWAAWVEQQVHLGKIPPWADPTQNHLNKSA